MRCPYNYMAWRAYANSLKTANASIDEWRAYLGELVKLQPEGRLLTWNFAHEALDVMQKKGMEPNGIERFARANNRQRPAGVRDRPGIARRTALRNRVKRRKIERIARRIAASVDRSGIRLKRPLLSIFLFDRRARAHIGARLFMPRFE